MKAKDTVMSDEQVRANCYWALKEWEIREGGLETVKMNLKAQAEISFKAGIREVLEFIPLQEYLKQSELIEDVPIWIGLNWEETQAQLKEWGITP